MRLPYRKAGAATNPRNPLILWNKKNRPISMILLGWVCRGCASRTKRTERPQLKKSWPDSQTFGGLRGRPQAGEAYRPGPYRLTLPNYRQGYGHLLAKHARRNPAPSRDAAAVSLLMRVRRKPR